LLLLLLPELQTLYILLQVVAAVTFLQSAGLTVNDFATVDAGPAMDPLCQGGTTDPLGGSVGGSATGGTWTSSVGGTFDPVSGQPGHENATWTPPSNYKGTATLTLTTTGPCDAVNASKQVTVYEQPVIAVHPADQTDCYQRVVDFNVSATGTGLTYTWYRKRTTDPDFLVVNDGGTDPHITYQNGGATLRIDYVGDNNYNPDNSQYKVIVSNGNCSTESNVATLTVNRITAINNSVSTPSVTNVVICSGSNFSYQVTTNHPENEISFQWKKWISAGVWEDVVNSTVISGATTSQLTFTNATIAESGEYKVTIRFSASDPSGCTVTSDNFTRAITFLPSVEAPVITESQTICYNTVPDELTATEATGGSDPPSYTYQWQSSPDNSNWSDISGATTRNYQPPALTASTYYRIVATDTGTSNCGTAESESVLITVEAAPTATAVGSQTICPEDQATVSGASATNYSAILWTHDGNGTLTGETTLTPTYAPAISDAGNTVTLTMTVTGSNSCGSTTAEAFYTVIVNDQPTATIDYPGSPYCGNGTATVTLTGQTGGTFSSTAGLSVNASTGEINLSASTPGTYTVTYDFSDTNSCGNSTTTEVTVNEWPLAETGPDGNICVGESVTLGVPAISGHSYNWESDIDGFISNDAQITVSPDVTTVYTLTETVDATSCENFNSVTVTSNQLIDVTVDPATLAICSGETTNIQISSNYIGTTFNWTTSFVSGSATTGFSDGSGSTIAQTLTNNSGVTEIIKYDIIATAGSCANANPFIEVTVYPATPVPTITSGTTTICQGESVELTSSAASGYQWFKDGVAISGETSQTHTASTAGDYTVEITDANGCSAISAPTTVIVNPLPTATISGTAEVCMNDAEPSVTFTGSGGTEPYTFTYNINGGTDLTVTTISGNSISVNAPTGIAGTFIYNLLSVQDASSTNCSNTVTDQSAAITVNPLPTATIATSATEVCQDDTQPVITFTGDNGTAPYTFTYTVNGGSAQTISTSGAATSVTLNVPTNTAGDFEYNLTSVQDASSTTCSNAVTGETVTITVNPLSTATISGTTTVCQDDAEPEIVFTGNGGSEPYTFVYRINGGADQTVTTTIGNTVSVPVATGVAGTFTYTLVTVEEGSTTSCENAASGTATVTVKPVPAATIGGDKVVCQDESTPAILFTGSNGTAPYTFTYKINGGANQTVTTTGGNNAVVFAPTDVAGTFEYELVSVRDGGTNYCTYDFVPGTEVVTVTVNPLPDATIDGTAEVCQNGAQPVLTLPAVTALNLILLFTALTTGHSKPLLPRAGRTL
jgi:hypothetical protein